jgi:8-oxo-dGTP pyrophosphatase MutT (NUDIX family)
MKQHIQPNLLGLLEEITAIAQLGLNYSKDPYDRGRYSRLLELAAGEYADFTGFSTDSIRQRFTRELGYITPKIGVQGALFNAEGKILLEQRVDDALWGLPAGWVEAEERPETAIAREFHEETGFIVEPIAILGFNSRLPGDFGQPHTSVHILYLCKCLGGQLQISHESLQMTFLDPSTVKEWHMDHGLQAEKAVQFWTSIGASLPVVANPFLPLPS